MFKISDKNTISSGLSLEFYPFLSFLNHLQNFSLFCDQYFKFF